MTILMNLWNILSGKLKIYAGILLIALVAVISIRRSGIIAERVEREKTTLRAIGVHNREEVRVKRLPYESAAERLRDKWSRD